MDYPTSYESPEEPYPFLDFSGLSNFLNIPGLPDYSNNQSQSSNSNSNRPTAQTPDVETPSIRYYRTLTQTSPKYTSPYEATPDKHDHNLALDQRFLYPGRRTSSRSPSVASSVHPRNHISSRAPSVRYSSSVSSRSTSAGPSRHYRPPIMSQSSIPMSTTERDQILSSLRTHRINTLPELRRIERLFTSDHTPETTEALSKAWAHYVDSNNMLSELRALTRDYPFSSACLDDAKRRVNRDSTLSRSRNYCRAVLMKIKDESLIPEHARQLANKPAMWGGQTPSPTGVAKLTGFCIREWSAALEKMLRAWKSSPSTPTGMA